MHAVDVGNLLKSKLRNLNWFARGNILRNEDHEKEPLDNQNLVNNIETILQENVAMEISEDAEAIAKH